MASGFISIPDWFSWENEGAGIAVGDLSGSGRPDLVVMMVDSPAGRNRGFYRIGKDLDAAGNVTGGWTDWIEVPDWFSFSNQGAGIALADLNGDGHLDLLVFMIDDPLGKNRGMYRVGRSLDTTGAVTGGWTKWIEIPDWFSSENDGGSIAVADLDGSGQPDLVVMMVDAPVGPNRGLYRVGMNLDASGAVTGGWSDWKEVPGWFSSSNQGAGVAVADLRNGGASDLLVFMVDNPLEQNQAFYRIGGAGQADGSVDANEWSPWFGVPGWFSWENQGAAIATAQLGAPDRHQLLVLLVDNPAGQNAGLYRVLELENDPKTQGEWQLLPYDSGVLAVHAAVLPKGKVLFFAGSGNSAVRFNSPDFGDTAKQFWCSVVWDPAVPPTAAGAGSFFRPDTLRGLDGKPIDFFCGGETFLADGRLIAAGGTQAYDVDGEDRPLSHGFQGRRDALAFDPVREQWTALKGMAHGRWYPTLISLGDGRVLAASGLSEDGHVNHSLEVFTPNGGQGTWRELHLPALGGIVGLPLYAHLFLLAGGRIFFSGGRMDDVSPMPPCILDIGQDPVRVRLVEGLQAALSRNQSASVLLPPAQDQKVMIIGGALPFGETNATDRVDVIDLKDLAGPPPRYHAAAALNLPRLHLNAVLLPDRTVMVHGGALQREGGEVRKTVARLETEIYDLSTDTWRMAATAQVARMYHSVALLLPDGSVVAASGNPDKGHHVEWGNDPNEELRLEVYKPPYFFRGPRPVIGDVPADWTYGQSVTVPSPQAASIRWASLIRPGVTTHSFDTTQRLVDLPIEARGDGELTVSMTPDPNLAPPGYYMLFLTDTGGVPSVASWIRLA